jgi:glycosyltransferase involved in cell wall biosynthesis
MNNLYISRELKGYELSDYVTIPSNFVYRSFIMNGFNSKKLFLNNLGVSLIQFTNKNLKKNKFIIIYVGLLSFQKGSHYLLEAIYDLLVNQNINLEFWHVGKVSNEIENIKLKYQHKKIIYKGYVKQIELVNYYNESSVFVMPSIQEGMASVQLQAMACGLPIISTTNTGGDDLISNNEEGFIIPIRDVTSLKEKILFFYNNRDYAEKMGKRALKKVSSGFTWNEYSRRLLDKLEMIKN